MELIRLIPIAAILLLELLGPAFASVDDPVITLASPADVAARRAALIDVMYGVTTLPTTQAIVTQGVSNPYGSALPNVARVDQYVANMSNGQVITDQLWIANSPSNRRVVIVNMGHQGTCDWPSFAPSYGTVPLLTALLVAGYSVYGMNQPGCGTGHVALFSTYGSAALQYFVEPAVQAMNYWDAHHSFSRYDYVGLSGGGWTGTVLPALDTRVGVSVAVAGSVPGEEFICWGVTGATLVDGSAGGAEGNWAPYFSVAGYLDQYLMAAYGTNRRQIQILNQGDDCCWGPAQWIPCYSAAHGGLDWWSYLANYWATLRAAQPSVSPSRYHLYVDQTSTSHQISGWARDTIITNAFANATGGRHR